MAHGSLEPHYYASLYSLQYSRLGVKKRTHAQAGRMGAMTDVSYRDLRQNPARYILARLPATDIPASQFFRDF